MNVKRYVVVKIPYSEYQNVCLTKWFGCKHNKGGFSASKLLQSDDRDV